MSAVSAGASKAWVVDAFVVAKWFLPVEREPEGELAREAVGRFAMRTTSLAFYEVGNILSTHSGGWNEKKIDRALGLMLEICGDPLDLLPGDYRTTAELALAHGLSFYDASYVAIARRMGRGVLSADGDLLGPGLASSLKSALA
jgi:predicted nucleic acid-binding protein